MHTEKVLAKRTPAPAGPRPGRNDPCGCGSGRKYKQCCLASDDARASAARADEASKDAGQSASELPAATPRPQKHQTHQPWKGATSRGFVPKSRTPRKVGGS